MGDLKDARKGRDTPTEAWKNTNTHGYDSSEKTKRAMIMVSADG